MFEDELLKEETEDYMLFEDYTFRKIKLYRSVFNRYTKGNYRDKALRVKLFPHIEEVLKDPFEVWINTVTDDRTDLIQSRYIKLYSDMVVVVDALFDDRNNLIMREWYDFDTEKEDEATLRKGVLIMSKAME